MAGYGGTTPGSSGSLIGKEHLTVRVGATATNYKRVMKTLGPTAKRASTGIRVAMVAAGASISALGIAAANVGKEFQFQLRLTAEVAGATGAEFDMLRKKARELGKTTAFTASQAAAGMYGFASAGFKAKEIAEAVGHSLHLAGAFAYDLYETTNLVASSIRIFGYETSQTQRIVDAYTQGITSSLLTMEKLSFAVSYAGPIAAGFGMTVEETTLALAQFANIGLEGTRIGVAFRMMMKAASKATQEKTAALEKYGKTMKDVSPVTKKFQGIIKLVADTAMSVQDAMKVFGARSGAYVVAIANMMREGVLDWEKSLKGYQDAVGRTEEIYTRMMGTFKNLGIIVKSVWQDVLISVFDLFQADGKQVMMAMRDEIERFTQYIQDNKEEIQAWFHELGKLIIQIVRATKEVAKASVIVAEFIIILTTIKTAIAAWQAMQLAIVGVSIALKGATLSLTNWSSTWAAIFAGAKGGFIALGLLAIAGLMTWIVELQKEMWQEAKKTEEWMTAVQQKAEEMGLNVQAAAEAFRELGMNMEDVQNLRFEGDYKLPLGTYDWNALNQKEQGQARREQLATRKAQLEVEIAHKDTLIEEAKSMSQLAWEADKLNQVNEDIIKTVGVWGGAVGAVTEDTKDLGIARAEAMAWQQQEVDLTAERILLQKEYNQVVQTQEKFNLEQEKRIGMTSQSIKELFNAYSKFEEDFGPGFVQETQKIITESLKQMKLFAESGGELGEFFSVKDVRDQIEEVFEKYTGILNLSKEAKEALKEVADILYAATHTDLEVQLKELEETADEFERILGDQFDRAHFIEVETTRILREEYKKRKNIRKEEAKFKFDMEKKYIELTKGKFDAELFELETLEKAYKEKYAGDASTLLLITKVFNQKWLALHKEAMQEELDEFNEWAEEKKKIEAELHETIDTYGMSDIAKEEYKLNKELELLREAKIAEEAIINEYEIVRRAELRDKATEQAVESYNEQVEEYNDAVQSMADDFKSIFIQSTQSEWKGWEEYWEDVLDRMRNTFLDWILTIVMDWAAGMFKMQTISATTSLVPGTSGATTGGGGGLSALVAGGQTTSGGAGGVGSMVIGQGGSMILGKVPTGKLLPMLASKIPGIGGALTATTIPVAASAGGGSLVTTGAAAGAEMYGALGMTTAAQDMGTVAAGSSLGWASSAIYGAGAGAVGAIGGGLIGSNYGQTHGKAAGAGMGAGTGAAMGAGMGFMVGGPIGALVGAIVGLIGGAVGGGLFSADPVKRKRQARGELTLGAFTDLASGDFSSTQNMMAAMPWGALDAKGMYSAINYKNLPDSDYWYVMQDGMTQLKSTMETLGSMSPNVANSIDITSDSLDILFQQMEHLDPELAKGIKGLQDNLKKTFSAELLQRIERGIVSLKNARDQLEDLGLDDAETMTKLYESAVNSLFSDTFPKSEIQLQNTYDELREMNEEMREAERTSRGLGIAQKLLANGIEFTAEELAVLVSNGENLQKLEWINIYDAMGLDQIYLAPPAIDDMADSIEAMRVSLESADMALENFIHILQSLPNSAAELRYQLGGIALFLEVIIDASEALVNVAEDLSELGDVMEDLKEAVEAKDWGAFADALGSLGHTATDAAQAAYQIKQVTDALSMMIINLFDWSRLTEKMFDIDSSDAERELATFWVTLNEMLGGIPKLVADTIVSVTSVIGGFISIVLQVIGVVAQWSGLILTITQIITSALASIIAFGQGFFGFLDIMSEGYPKLEKFTQGLKDLAVFVITFIAEIIARILEFIDAIFFFIDLFGNLPDMIREGAANFGEQFTNQEELGDAYKNFEDFFYKLNALSTETFLQMTEDIWGWYSALGQPAGMQDAIALAREYALYWQFILDNMEYVENALSGMTVESMGQEAFDKLDVDDSGTIDPEDLRQVAWDYYLEQLDKLIEAATKMWQDFADAITDEMGELDSQLAKWDLIAGGGSEEAGSEAYYLAEEKRLRDKATASMKDYLDMVDDETYTQEERLEALQEYHDYLRSALDAQISGIQAYYDEQERLIREKYEKEQEAIQKMIDLTERWASLQDEIKDLRLDVLGSGANKAAGFNVARQEVERIKKAIAVETDEDVLLDLYDELAGAYGTLWSEGSGLYGEDTEAFKLLQQEVIDGLDELEKQAGEEYTRQISLQERMTNGIEDIETSTANMEQELKDLREKEAKDIADAIRDYQWAIADLEITVESEIGTIATEISEAFYDELAAFAIWYMGEKAADVYLRQMAADIALIREKYTGQTGGGGNGGNGGNGVDPPDPIPLNTYDYYGFGTDSLAWDREISDKWKKGVGAITPGTGPGDKNAAHDAFTAMQALTEDMWTVEWAGGIDFSEMAIGFQMSINDWLGEWDRSSLIPQNYREEVFNFYRGLGDMIRMNTDPESAYDFFEAMGYRRNPGGGAIYFVDDMLSAMEAVMDQGGGAWSEYTRIRRHQGGIIPYSGTYDLQAGEIYTANTSGRYGLDGLAEQIGDAVYDAMASNQPQSSPQEKVIVFVPYNTSVAEQERIYQDVKQRLHDDSENEQIIYDRAIIQTNRGA